MNDGIDLNDRSKGLKKLEDTYDFGEVDPEKVVDPTPPPTLPSLTSRN